MTAMDEALAAVEAWAATLTDAERDALGSGDPEPVTLADTMPPRFSEGEE